jgi:hypothetical protein
MRRIDTRKFLFYRVVAPTRGEYQSARGPGQCQVLSGSQPLKRSTFVNMLAWPLVKVTGFKYLLFRVFQYGQKLGFVRLSPAPNNRF